MPMADNECARATCNASFDAKLALIKIQNFRFIHQNCALYSAQFWLIPFTFEIRLAGVNNYEREIAPRKRLTGNTRAHIVRGGGVFLKCWARRKKLLSDSRAEKKKNQRWQRHFLSRPSRGRRGRMIQMHCTSSVFGLFVKVISCSMCTRCWLTFVLLYINNRAF